MSIFPHFINFVFFEQKNEQKSIEMLQIAVGRQCHRKSTVADSATVAGNSETVWRVQKSVGSVRDRPRSVPPVWNRRFLQSFDEIQISARFQNGDAVAFDLDDAGWLDETGRLSFWLNVIRRLVIVVDGNADPKTWINI